METDIDYPASLPCPLFTGHAVQHVQPFVRSTMESGRARQRRRYTSVPSMQQFQWVMDAVQASAFEAWFRDTLLDGAEWFNLPTRNPLGRMRVVCRFTRMYEGPLPISPTHFRISSELEVYERPLMPEGWGLLPDYITEADIFDLAMNREWPAA